MDTGASFLEPRWIDVFDKYLPRARENAGTARPLADTKGDITWRMCRPKFSFTSFGNAGLNERNVLQSRHRERVLIALSHEDRRVLTDLSDTKRVKLV